MTQYLPPNLLALFAPRDPVPFLPPLDKLPHEKKLAPYCGVAQFLQEFEDPKDTPPPTRVETKDERKERKRKERAEQIAYKLEQDLALWDPTNDTNSGGDPYKSLFVARINYDTSESKLRREFEVFGPVRRIRIVSNPMSTKPRGYAFVEYEHERDMHSAYKHADGKKIDGRRVLVDIERGRTIKGWRPRRLGGGLGGTRKGGPDVNTKYSGRDDGAGNLGREERSRSREHDESRERDNMRRDRVDRRHRSRERPDRPERPERPDRRRSKSRERRKRSRSRERKRSREREQPRPEEENAGVAPEEAGRDRRRRRSRSRDRKRRRSRSRDRKNRSDSRERKPRSRSRERARQVEVPTGEPLFPGDEGFAIKEEKDRGYGDVVEYDNDTEDYKNPYQAPPPPPPENGTGENINFQDIPPPPEETNEYGTVAE